MVTLVRMIDWMFAPKLSLFVVLGGLATGQSLANGDYVLAAFLVAVAIATTFARQRFTPTPQEGEK